MASFDSEQTQLREHCTVACLLNDKKRCREEESRKRERWRNSNAQNDKNCEDADEQNCAVNEVEKHTQKSCVTFLL